jgi:hypothetical protein
MQARLLVRRVFSIPKHKASHVKNVPKDHP